MNAQSSCEEEYTLLCVRPDGVAPVVEIVVADDVALAQARARALLREHASSAVVEIWTSGELLERVAR